MDFSVWGYIEDNVFIPPLPRNIDKLWNQIKQTITKDCNDNILGASEETK